MVDRTPVALKVGMLAHYATTFNGLIPCKVLDFRKNETLHVWEAKIRLTASYRAYERGEILWEKASDVVPRDRRCRYQKDYHHRVLNCWHIEHEGKRHDIFASADD